MIELTKKNWKFLLVTLIVAIIAITFRFVGLTHAPPSLYWEEVALGYDAYSIAKTLKDHHGNTLPIVAFESFGDWKPSLYFYALAPFVGVLGLEPWVVRLPSVLSGISIVLAVGLLAARAATDLSMPKSKWIGVAASLLTAISPWALMFSRAGWEVNLATALVTWAMVAGLYAISTKNNRFFSISKAIVASLLLVAAAYTYHGTRLLAPLLGTGLSVYWLISLVQKKQKPVKYIWHFIIPGFLGILLILPILIKLQTPEVSQRLAETSIFSQLDPILESNNAKQLTGNSFLSSVFYHRYILFGRHILENFFSHFAATYLFISGESNLRHSTGFGGLLHYQDALFLLVGVALVCLRRRKVGIVLVCWWFLAILPASVTTAVPHALRTLPAMPAILVLISLGLARAFFWLQKTTQVHLPRFAKAIYTLSTLAIALLYIGTFSAWWRYYYVVYPKLTSSEWQYGYQQMIDIVNTKKEEFSELPIFITREQGRPAMYYWFFSETDPSLVQAENSRASKDQSEFTSFQTVTFPRTTSEIVSESAIVASSPEGKIALADRGYSIEPIASLSDLSGKNIWDIYRIY